MMDGLGVAILLLVILSFILFLIRVALIFYHNILLSRELKRIAREAEGRQTDNPVVIGTDNQTNQPPKDDLPPAYDEVVHAKLALQAAEEGRMAANRSNAQSTITLATFVDTNASNGDLSVTTRATINSNQNSDETLPPAYENAVFEHDLHENDINNNGNTNTNRAT